MRIDIKNPADCCGCTAFVKAFALIRLLKWMQMD